MTESSYLCYLFSLLFYESRTVATVFYFLFIAARHNCSYHDIIHFFLCEFDPERKVK